MIDLRKPATATQPQATGLTRCRLPLARTRADIAARYPNLLRAMQGVAILSPNEATGALDSLIMHGIDCAGEAVNHYGGCLAVVRQAWQFRGHYRPRRYTTSLAAYNADQRKPYVQQTLIYYPTPAEVAFYATTGTQLTQENPVSLTFTPAQLEVVEHALLSFRHLLPRNATSTTTTALAREIRRTYDAQNQHTACVLNTLAALPGLTLTINA